MNELVHDTRLRSFHLFAGAGGGILADLLLGHLPVGACEIEEYPRKVLLQRQRDGILPFFPIWDDIQTFDGRPWRGHVEIVAGGFPCQDISAAGKGAGIGGERSGLWGEMARVIGEIRPRFVFVENSPLLVGRGLAVVLGDLAAMGYDAKWGVLGAHHVAAPHKRDRIWILGYSARESINGSVDESNTKRGRETPSPGAVESGNSDMWGFFSDSERRDREVARPSSRTRRERKPISRGTPWKTLSEPLFSRVDERGSNYLDRLKAIGNGQVPICAAYAWRLLSRMD